MNISSTVIIPTVGLGSRMGHYTTSLNKALLPYKNKPIIGHIIENFPKDYNFIIPVGYLSKQVIDFCSIAYSDRKIKFIQIDDYTSEFSGTATTIKQCQELINSPFWYVPCDTFYDQKIVGKVSDNDCYFVKSVNKDSTYLYTMFDIDEKNKIKSTVFKRNTPDTWFAFTGVMYIYDWKSFFDRLCSINSVEIIDTIKIGSDILFLESWLDFGNPVEYKKQIDISQKFDFTKNDEITYICNDKVIKWWKNDLISEKKYKKILNKPDIFPTGCSYIGNFLAYDFFPGKTLYEHNNPEIFNNLLNWLNNNVWTKTDFDIKSYALDFYKEKTLLRVNKFLKKYPNLSPVHLINGVKVKGYEYYLNEIDWNYLSTNVIPGFIHGDLQFDNIVYDNNNFAVIDWRHEFSTLIDCGDIYYDLAKLLGGLIIDYSKIKNNNFNINIDNNNVTLTIPNVENIFIYQDMLKKFIDDNNLDYQKVKLLVPIIFWNMSPLHTEPFDIFLWYLGIYLFSFIYG